MNADAILEMVGAGVLAPAIASLGIYWLSSSLLSKAAAARSAVGIGFVAGFVIGYLLLPDWAELIPSRHWHWLPWLGLAGGVTGSIGVCAAPPKRWLLMLATSVAAAWFLVPTWPSLDPPRFIWLVALSVGLVLLIGLMDPLPPRIGGRLFLGMLSIAAVALAAMIAACVSVTYARIAGVAACSLVGVWGGTYLRQSDDEIAVRAAIPASLIVVGGIAFVACVESERPQYGLLLLPACPLGLWISRSIRQLSGRRATVLRIASVVIPLLVAAAVSYARVL